MAQQKRFLHCQEHVLIVIKKSSISDSSLGCRGIVHD